MKKKQQDLKIAILCGGAGTRMWPMSRQNQPKQFQLLVGKESTFQIIIKILTPAFPVKNIFPVTRREYVGYIVQQAPEIPLENIIIEPEGRDTAAALGFAAVVLKQRFGSEAVIASLWSDHLVKTGKQLIDALKAGFEIAQKQNVLVGIDVRPTFASTQLGYIKLGKMIKKIDGLAIFEFAGHVEKPDENKAREFTKSWEYLWHTGFKIWKTKTLLNLYQKHAPVIYDSLKTIEEFLSGKNKEEAVVKEYATIPKISFDFTILEKLINSEQVIISADLDWSDIGTWNILKDELAKSKEENVIEGENTNLKCSDCLIYGSNKEKIIAAIGISGLVIVDTPDVLLVCRKDCASDVKKIVEKLKKEDRGKYI